MLDYEWYNYFKERWPTMRATLRALLILGIGVFVGGFVTYLFDRNFILEGQNTQIKTAEKLRDLYQNQKDQALKDLDKSQNDLLAKQIQISTLTEKLDDAQRKINGLIKSQSNLPKTEDQNNKTQIKDTNEFERNEFKQTVYEFLDSLNPEILKRARAGELVIPIHVTIWACAKFKILSQNHDFNDIVACIDARIITNEAKKKGMDISHLNPTIQLTKDPTPCEYILIPLAELRAAYANK